MSYQRAKSVNFGRSRSGLLTVAWSLDGGSTWSTAGVSESPTGSGIYKATLTFPDNFSGSVDWKTGEGGVTERFASEDINSAESDSASAILGAAVGGGTLLEAIATTAAVVAGNVSQSSDGMTDSFSDFKDPETTRVTSVSSPTQREVTIH